MQNKGVIKFFAIAFALICIYQLSFTFFTSRVEKKARDYANNESVKKQASEIAKGNVLLERMKYDSISASRERYFLDSMSNQVIYNILIRKYTYKECQEREINLGLDLKGGMNVTLEISVVDIIRAMSGYSIDPTFNKALALAQDMQRNSQEDFVTLFGKAFEQTDKHAKLAAIFNTVELKDKISYNSSNADVLKVIRQETDGAIDRTFNVLRTRIDRFGVTSPNIQKLQTAGRILVELPGIKEPERVRKLLQGTAKLEFWETFENQEIYPFIAEANKRLRSIQNAKDSIKVDSVKNNKKVDNKNIAKNKTEVAKTDDKSGKDTSKSSLAILNKLKNDSVKGDSNKAKGEKSFEEFSKENPLFAYFRPALVQDEKGNYFPSKGPVVGYSAIMDTAKVNSILNLPFIKSAFPRNIKLLWTVKPFDKKGTMVQLIAIKVTSRDGSAPLGGDVVVDARQDFGQNNSNEISMTMNSEGARTWKRLTADNIGKSIAVVLDNYVYSFPTVNSEIPNGRSSITGGFTLEEAKDLANILKAGKLPAPARIVEEAVVGPSLGQESINAGLLSFVVGFIGVLLYMSLYYSRAGNVANIALFANVLFLFGTITSIGTVLTLPGIAGMVLTLAMAVDGNVIIYERMREEVRAGKGMGLVIKDGFWHALSSIIDGHVTTILTGIVLFMFGSGPIQGFAVTLIIGLLLSLFSSIFISRLVFEWMLDRKMNIKLGYKYTLNAFQNTKINFIGIRKIMYVISSIIILIGIISLFVRGLDPSVEFTGGRTYIVRFDQSVKTTEIRTSLTKVFHDAPEVKTFGNDNQVKITTKFLIEDKSAKADSIVDVTLFEGLKPHFKKQIEYKEFSEHSKNKTVGELSSQKVDPTISDDLIRQAFMSVFFGLVIIFIYIAIRFKNWKYGLGGVISLFHDTMVVITMFTLLYKVLPFSLEIDQQFIAALLTIIGYSIMDTVIIFDRIREYNILYPKRELSININAAINSTLGRTINTSGITMVVLLVIFIFGGEMLRGFIFALLVGVSIGTYSSVFNATPLAYDFIMMAKRRKEKKMLKK